MRQLRQKLNSQSGASILLALLFLLVCMMVAASILMAAVSNAGKIRSNYEEQQNYLALSSALRLAVGEVEKAGYTGNYQVYEWAETFQDEHGEPYTIEYYHIQQIPGKFTCGALKRPDFTGILDGQYATQFSGSDRTPLSPSGPPATQTLTVKVTGDPAADKFPEVQVSAEMQANRTIRLTAKLFTERNPDGTLKEDGKSYSMSAELAAEGNPLIEYSAGGRLPGSLAAAMEKAPSPQKRIPSDESGGSIQPDVTWKLSWISKEVEDT